MKKFTMIIVLVCVSSAVFAGSWIEPITTFKASWAPNTGGTIALYDNSIIEYEIFPENLFTFDITVGATLFDFFWFETQVVTFTAFTDANPINGMFAPYQSDYGVRVGLSKWGLRVGYEHWCFHPVTSYGRTTVQRYGGSDEFFIEFDLQRMLKD